MSIVEKIAVAIAVHEGCPVYRNHGQIEQCHLDLAQAIMDALQDDLTEGDT